MNINSLVNDVTDKGNAVLNVYWRFRDYRSVLEFIKQNSDIFVEHFEKCYRRDAETWNQTTNYQAYVQTLLNPMKDTITFHTVFTW